MGNHTEENQGSHIKNSRSQICPCGYPGQSSLLILQLIQIAGPRSARMTWYTERHPRSVLFKLLVYRIMNMCHVIDLSQLSFSLVCYVTKLTSTMHIYICLKKMRKMHMKFYSGWFKEEEIIPRICKAEIIKLFFKVVCQKRILIGHFHSFLCVDMLK